MEMVIKQNFSWLFVPQHTKIMETIASGVIGGLFVVSGAF
jgi:hypothetical protein